jgi:hypothetical protein
MLFMECSEFLLVLSNSTEYTVTKEDVGSRLKFVYTPVNLEGLFNCPLLMPCVHEHFVIVRYIIVLPGQEGEAACATTEAVKKGSN